MPIVMSRTGALARVGAALLVVATAACAAGPRTRPIKGGDVDTGGGTLTAARNFLEGSWTLLSFEIMPPGQAPIKINGQGTLRYDEFSNLDMEIRVDEATARTLDRAGIPSTNGAISAKGRTAVDLQRKTLTYMLQGQQAFAPSTGPLDAKRPRYWDVTGNVLTLTTKADDGKELSVARWQKNANP